MIDFFFKFILSSTAQELKILFLIAVQKHDQFLVSKALQRNIRTTYQSILLILVSFLVKISAAGKFLKNV